jgi:MinD superfamily P-loop ATPase
MIIAIASGKGGAGKTTIATALAALLGERAVYADADVEAPNGHLFLHPEFSERREHLTPTVRVDHDACTFCGKCSEVCRFGAIAVLPKSVMVFDELCKGCGGCLLACPENAISEHLRPIGELRFGRAAGAQFTDGVLNVGEAMSPPLIRALRAEVAQHPLVLVDAPPGVSCPVVAAVHNTDYCVLVAESTPFGLHDLELAVELMREMHLPFGVVVNRVGLGDDRVPRYCETAGIRLLGEIPDDRRLAEAYAAGGLATDVPELREAFVALWSSIADHAGLTTEVAL